MVTRVFGPYTHSKMFIQTHVSRTVRKRHLQSCAHTYTGHSLCHVPHPLNASHSSSLSRQARRLSSRSWATLRSAWHGPPSCARRWQSTSSQSMTDSAELPPRSREAMQPAPAASVTSAPGNLLPSDDSRHSRRCADAPATRRSCARHRGGDGAVEARRSHQTAEKSVPRQRVGNSKLWV